MEKRGRGRPRTGSVDRHDDHYDVRITLPDGSRTPPRCLPRGTSEDRAREIAKAMTEEAQRQAAAERAQTQPEPAKPPAEEPIEDWAERWCKLREARGMRVKENRGHLDKWILPVLRGKPMARIPSEDLERVVETLDAAVLAGTLSWKSASNTWGTASKMFSDACKGKAATLRVRKDNPALSVMGPDKGDERSKSYLYPSEFLALVRCERVPIRWRRLFTIAIYAYMRPGELEALGPGDVDRERRLFHVHQAIDRQKGRDALKGTKTKATRRVPIESTLLPLIDLYLAEARELGTGRILTMPAICDLSDRLRKYLRWAGVTRAELFADDKTRKQITFYDLRATGITWMAIRGDEPLRIQSRAGHKDFRTTQGYIREAENLEGAIRPEDVFPELPPEVFSAGIFGSRRGFAELSTSTAEVSSGVHVRKGVSSCVDSADTYADDPSPNRVQIPLGTRRDSLVSSQILTSPGVSAKNPTENTPAELGELTAGMAALRWLDGELDAFLAAGGDEGAELTETLRRARDAAPSTVRSAGGDR